MEEFLAKYVPLALSVIVLGGHLTGWFSAAGKKASSDLDSFKSAAKDKFDVLDKELAGHDRRVQKLEDALIHLPTSKDFHRLELAMTTLTGQVGVLNEKLDGNIEALTDKVKKTDQAVVLMQGFMQEVGK